MRCSKYLLVAVTALLQLSQSQQKGERVKSDRSQPHAVAGVLGNPQYQLLNINNITSWMRADGQSNHAPSKSEGSYYPRGMAPVIYQDGIVWGGKVFLDRNYTTPAPVQAIRVGGQMYTVGTRAGHVIGFGPTAVPADTSSPEVRIYRIRRDFYQAYYEFSYDLRVDAASYFELSNWWDATDEQVYQVFQQYQRDWDEWPVQYGAPYIERNGIPGYQAPPVSALANPRDLIEKRYDEPGIAGADPDSPADQVIWTVYNDLHPQATLSFLMSEPLGLEVQVTLWAYKGYDAIGNIYFKKAKLINKGGVDVGGGTIGAFWIDSMFIGQWSDPDVGNYADDLVGCDTLLNMGFAYNSKGVDDRFQRLGLAPPAIGYDLLQGPIVQGVLTDSAVFDLKRIRGKKNLPMTSFVYQLPGNPLADPIPSRQPWLQVWRMLRGYLPNFPDSLYPHPPGVTPTKFPLSGDPVARKGFIDGLGTTYSFEPGDRRLLMSSGPFTLAPGDTQEILIAAVAGLGADHVSSISAMKFNDRAAKRSFRGLFAIPRPPASPSVQVVELDREIVLEWGSDHDRVRETEEKLIAGEYRFEGYNVYQLPFASAPYQDWVRIATFDVKNDVRWIIDDKFDAETGLIVPTIVQRGENTGLGRFIKISRDFVESPYGYAFLRNGQEYYFAVTAYNYSSQPNALPRSLESVAQVLTVKPRMPFGVRLKSAHGDTLRVTHTQGNGRGAVYPVVINPLVGTGDTYEVRVDTSGGSVTWYARNVSAGKLIVAGQANFSGGSEYPIVEGGILLAVVSQPLQLTMADVFVYTIPAPESSPDITKESARRVGVFPNPYIAGRSQETVNWQHFVTFNNLPPRVTIRIYNLAGHLVRTLQKDNPSQFLEWDLTNENNWQVASGMYICYVEMPEINEVKILKLAVIQPQSFQPQY